MYLAQSPESLLAPKPSCWFIFAGMWLFVYNYVSTDSWDGFAEKKYWKRFFLTRRWSIEIVPDLSLPPCMVMSKDPVFVGSGSSLKFSPLHPNLESMNETEKSLL